MRSMRKKCQACGRRMNEWRHRRIKLIQFKWTHTKDGWLWCSPDGKALFTRAELKYIRYSVFHGILRNKSWSSTYGTDKRGRIMKMTPNEYQRLADRTASFTNTKDRIINGGLGLTGESGEVADLIKKTMFQGHKLSKDDLIKELGDVCWYVASLCTALDVDFEQVLTKNIEKLWIRYPNGFSREDSIERRDEGDDQ